MSFFEQAWIGLRKELAVYKNEPKLLISKAASVVIFVILTVVTGTTSGGTLQDAVVTNALCQILLFFTPARTILFKVSSEREDNFKEYLMINGMTKAAYQAKIAVSNYIEVFFFAIPQTIGLYLSYHTYFTTWTVVFPMFVVLLLGGMGVINMALYLSTLFNPKNAPPMGSMIILLLGLLYFIPTAASSTMPLYIIVSLHPGAAIAFGVNVLLPDGGANGTDITWAGYNAGLCIAMLAVDIFLYLGLYLFKERERDADIKHAQKQQKANLAPFLQNAENMYDLEMTKPVNFSSATHTEKRAVSSATIVSQIATIEAFNMKKVYPECTAVDDITFSIFEEEIYCLLGHNGAGKTTLVNILTGLIPKTEGTFFYNGKEVSSNLDTIRGNVGFCPQKDFLLMENTVYDNLSFFAEIKNVPKDQQEAEIERVMNKLGLNVHKDMPAKKLSGGFKRKLNVGIALLKDPKIIIMDEPTSGMDPVSRRTFWNIIKDLKNEKKTVILTTQFLDEAEELADRIAIMAKGKFYAVGTSDFLKKKFGTGYNFVIEKSDGSVFSEAQGSELTSVIQATIPTATRNLNVTSNVVQFTLPFQEQSKFSSLFAKFENMPGVQVGLQMVSLEEAFVSLGLSLEKHSGDDEANRNQHQVPSAFFRDRTPTFGDQLKAVLFARLYRMKRNIRVYFLSSFPLIFILAGIGLGGSFDSEGGLSLMITMILTGNAFLINSFTVPVAVERIAKITHGMKAMGLRTLPYWIGNLIVDFSIKLVMSLLVLAAIYVFNVEFLQDVVGQFMGLYIGFSFNMIIMAYNMTLIFDSQFSVMIAGPALLIGGAYLPKLISGFLSNWFGIYINMYVYIITFIFFGPAILLQIGINLMVPEYADTTYLTYAPFSQTWAYIIVSFGMGILYFIRLLYADSKIFELKEKKTYTENSDDKVVDIIEEEDVHNEKEKLRSPFNTYSIKALEVTKVYPNGFKALHDLSFGVEKGNVFCLLGPNGAGKTTAFEILTTTIPKTEGVIQLEGKDLSRKEHELFYNIGVCSQSNTIWDTVTVEEHLRVYARIKGMSGAEMDEAIRYLIKALKLEEYGNRVADKLSGGNKRKLCVAMSMIGAPKMLFLDEPSTGMDPVARNYLWNLIKDVMKAKQGAMILTTHYMQEAELVGDKLGILVNGRFTTIGSMSELKRRFGEYSVIIYETEGGLSALEIEKIVKSVLPESRIQHTSNDKGLVFKVPSNAMKFAQIFSELENIKSMDKIKDFSIYTTTLEQIFIKLAKNQRRMTEF